MGSGGQNQEPGIGHAANTNRARRRRGHRCDYDDVPALDFPAPVASPLPRWRARRLATRTSQRICTLEHPPPLHPEFRASGSHSGSAACDPILAFDQYVVSATDDGRVCVYSMDSLSVGSSLHQSDLIQTSIGKMGPNFVAGPFYQKRAVLTTSPAIVALAGTPTGITAIHYHDKTENVKKARPHHFLGHVAVLTSDGAIHILEFKNQPLDVTKVHSWSTGLGGVTCFAFHSNNTSPDLDCVRLCMGCETGCLTDWEISAPVSTNGILDAPKDSCEPHQQTTADKTDDISSEKVDSGNLATKGQATNSETDERLFQVGWDEAETRLLWRGSFDGAVKSVSSLGTHCNTENQSEGVKDAARKRSDYLAVCVAYSEYGRAPEEPRSRMGSVSSIEVINISSVERDFDSECASSESQKGDFGSLPLAPYCTWPEAGMEIMDTATLGASEEPPERRGTLPRRIRAIPSRGTDRLFALNGEKPAFATVLSEGTVALMHSFENTSGESGDPNLLSWGVAHEGNQLLLSYPCIGAGFMDIRKEEALVDGQVPSQFFACCLRGGTVYVTPVFEKGVEPTSQQMEVMVFPCPDNTDSESSAGTMRYVQGFAAGNLLFQESQDEKLNAVPRKESWPIFLYSWVGGMMDVYVGGLLPYGHRAAQGLEPESHDDARHTLRELAENGTFTLLLDLLLSLEESDKRLEEPLWNEAWKECLNREEQVEADQLIQELLREDAVDFLYFRSLLLRLSRERIVL